MTNINVEQLLRRAVLSHLSDDELGAFHDNAVDEVARNRIEAHLSRCLICERKLMMMQDVLATYHQEPVTAEDITRAKVLLHRQEIVAMLRTVLSVAFAAWIRQHHIRVTLRGASAAGPAKRHHGKTEAGALFWSIVEEEWGDLVVRLGSHRMELAGVKLLLRSGSIEKAVALEPVGKSLVEAKAIFTREERAKLPEDVQLTIDIIK